MFRDYTKYEIFVDGRIWSKKSKKFLKPQTTRNGYQKVCLFDNEGKRHQEYVHRITWMAVNGVWEIPKCYDIHHCDEDKMNNQIANLLLCSHQENLNFGTRNERVSKAMKGKLINRQDLSKRVGAFKDGEMVMVFPSIIEAHRNGYDKGAICNCCNGNRKSHKGFTWKYLDE